MRRTFMVLAWLSMLHDAHAGFKAFTMHSRANCGNNESVSWEHKVHRLLATVSVHYKNGEFSHIASTGWENTWRSIASHANEAIPGNYWRVVGYHWQKINGQNILLNMTDTTGCHGYDGWWDAEYKHPATLFHTNNNETRTYDPNGNMLAPPIGIQVIPRTKKETHISKRDVIPSESPNPRELIKINYTAANEISDNKHNTDPLDTHLKATIDEIKLAFPFKGISFLKNENVIGYAAAGGYHHGWTGIKEFFNDKQLGVCSLTLYNIFLSKGGAQLNESAITYKINKKPTTTSIEGSYNSGFMYTVAWYDNTFVHLLECANMSLDKHIITKMLEYGVLIDKGF